MALRCVSTLLETVGDAVWRADALACAPESVLPSGHAALDAQLPGGGWPVGALCEILQTHPGQHEWRLLLPALRQVTQQQTPGQHQDVHGQPMHVGPGRPRARQVMLVGAPWTPFAPGLAGQGLAADALLWVQADKLAERLWAAEQALRCADVAALLLWLADAPSSRVRADHLRRLHLSAQAQAKLLFVMRPLRARDESSPAPLRLALGVAAGEVAGVGEDEGAGGQAVASLPDALALHILKRRGPPLAQTLWLPARPAALATLLEASAAQRQGAPQKAVEPHLPAMPDCSIARTQGPVHALDRTAALA